MSQIICTIGPASDSEKKIEQLLKAGMTVARLNLAHGTFESHKEKIELIRSISKSQGKYTLIAVDLPGPKIRIGKINGTVNLKQNNKFILTCDSVVGNQNKVSIDFNLTRSVDVGNIIYLNDGFIQLQVKHVHYPEIVCKILIGGILTSNKGVNVPNTNLKIKIFTNFDYECLKFAAEMHVELINLSFIEKAKDILRIRNVTKNLRYNPLIFAKIEKSEAIKNINSILKVSDGIMIARGDLGIETPIEQIAIIQKYLIQQAKKYNKGTIVATQMLESMCNNCRPTRAESTDVANSILDGADFVMLSGESAMGKYPVEATNMLQSIINVTKYYVGKSKIDSIF